MPPAPDLASRALVSALRLIEYRRRQCVAAELQAFDACIVRSVSHARRDMHDRWDSGSPTTPTHR
jgi:hypothetical protein